MPVAIAAIGGIAGKVVVSMITSLLTETFLRKTIIYMLERLVKKTASDLDDKLLLAAKTEWQV